MKKFRKSPLAIVCYVFAAIFAAYFVATEVTTITTIFNYYASYGMNPTFGEIASYTLQEGLASLTAAILVCMAGIILEEVRKLNPANWVTDEELAEKKEARVMARDAKKIARGEAAKAKAEAAADESETIKPEFSAAVAPEDDGVVVFGGEEQMAPENVQGAATEFAEEQTAPENVQEAATEFAEEQTAPEMIEEEKEFSDVFSAEVAAEENDPELAAELSKAVREFESK